LQSHRPKCESHSNFLQPFASLHFSKKIHE
jgi:hypothetical protein